MKPAPLLGTTWDKDGSIFGNRERGYYREDTVATPGSNHRDDQRIVCSGKPRVPDACDGIRDHCASFREIVEPPPMR
ncbi:hypothetical protein D5039_03910 [Verminephrobacter aporrectodeae subsp. tuberculatae]|uniref:Uncharacterized protein n=1 Tax=Verminephrobacter aporrectodeae subsp. tuberculatae TaxID=1110392 RepID=A0ABT3KPW7_9BURK|nr:hypothetical protein [Verminephrobacter aporrectodeae subsp. tuberculatae]MCW5320354.1 hypothetical protein [Verminephrobacter aporrectodeae subsp. tuberculatae]